MKRNGFTLIELLAVIVILAIIALIATPIILGIINDAREKANERSIDLYANAVRNAVAAYQLTSLNSPKTFSDLNVEYDGEVECTTKELYSDGGFYLNGCKVNDSKKEYSYGKERVCTRQTDAEGFDTVTCTIGENIESFYVLNNYLKDIPSGKILMLTKYNLDTTTYRQSSSAGNIAFSNTNPLSSTVSSYPAEVYDENSLVYPVVEGYLSYLNTKLPEATGSLLTYSQATDLGCLEEFDHSNPMNYYQSCDRSAKWVYSTNYWLSSAIAPNQVYGAGTMFLPITPNTPIFGVRPVITISTSEIK